MTTSSGWELSDDEIEGLFNRLPSSKRAALVEREVRANVKADGVMAASLLKAIGFDRATDIIHRNQIDSADGSLPPLDLGKVNAAQCSLFDNWNGPKKPVKNAGARYKATFELWSLGRGVPLRGGKRDRNSFWSASAGLFTTVELEREIGKLAKGRNMSRPWLATSPDDLRGADYAAYGDALLDASHANPGLRLGPCIVSKGRERYPLFTFAAVDAEALEARTDVVVRLCAASGSTIQFERFDTALPGKAPFGAECMILHARGSSRAEDKHFRTFILPACS